jgi:hypothetical protein
MADSDPVTVTTISNIRNTSIIRRITMKTSTAKDAEQDAILDLPGHPGNVHTQILDVDTLLSSSTAHPLKNQISSVITEMNVQMDNELGTEGAIDGSVYDQLNTSLLEDPDKLKATKASVHATLNSAITVSAEALADYRDAQVTGSNTLAETRASVKADVAIATAMDNYAKVISDTIDFGTYEYTTGHVKNFMIGLERYAPDLNQVTATGTRVNITTSTTVYFNQYARVYFVSQNGKISRLISSDNYTIRDGDYSKTELVNNFSASYFEDDILAVAVSAGTPYSILTTNSNLVGTSYSIPTVDPTASNRYTTAISSISVSMPYKIYYSIQKRVYLLKYNTVNQYYFIADGSYSLTTNPDRSLMSGYKLDANINSKDGVLLYSYIIANGYIDSIATAQINDFNDLSEIRPGIKAELVTSSDTIVKNTTSGLYYVKVVRPDQDNTTNVSTQYSLIPLRTRFGLHFQDGVYGQSATKAQLLAYDAFFFSADYAGTAASITHVAVN